MLNKKFNTANIPIKILLFLIIVSVGCSYIIKSTYDDGDSIMHYLISRYVFAHPINFFHHWGKPIFILFSSPFAYFMKWKGMVFFNILVTALSAYFTLKTSALLKHKYGILVILLFYFSPKSFLMQYSGLTEPLFGLFLILPLYFWLKGKPKTSLFILSFIIFSRSEGMMVCAIWLLYLIISGNYKNIPFVFSGFIIYAIAGYFYKNDFWWYFTDNPYSIASVYGHGQWNHFIIQYPHLVGIPVFIFLLLGIVKFILDVALINKRWKLSFFKERLFLIYGCFLAYFLFHSYAWANGLFASFGMTRVLIALMPLMALICVEGIENLLNIIKIEAYRKLSLVIFICAIVVFPFTKAKTGGFNWSSDFEMTFSQKVQSKASSWLIQNNSFPQPIYFSAPFLNFCLDTDPFDSSQHLDVSEFRGKNIKVGSVILHDSWYSKVESKVELNELLTSNNLSLIQKVKISGKENPTNDTYEINIFRSN